MFFSAQYDKCVTLTNSRILSLPLRLLILALGVYKVGVGGGGRKKNQRGTYAADIA